MPKKKLQYGLQMPEERILTDFENTFRHSQFIDYSKIKAFLSEAIDVVKQETELAFGGCKKCYGKGYATYKEGYSGRIGRGGKTEGWIEDQILPCSCDRGKQIKSLQKSNEK